RAGFRGNVTRGTGRRTPSNRPALSEIPVTWEYCSDPSTTRLMSRGPVGACTQSPYAYVAGNPLTQWGLQRVPLPWLTACVLIEWDRGCLRARCPCPHWVHATPLMARRRSRALPRVALVSSSAKLVTAGICGRAAYV